MTGERRSALLASVEVTFQIHLTAVEIPDPQHAPERPDRRGRLASGHALSSLPHAAV